MLTWGRARKNSPRLPGQWVRSPLAFPPWMPLLKRSKPLENSCGMWKYPSPCVKWAFARTKSRNWLRIPCSAGPFRSIPGRPEKKMWRDCSARLFDEKLNHWDGAEGTEEKPASIEKGSERRCKPWMGGFLDVYPREAL